MRSFIPLTALRRAASAILLVSLVVFSPVLAQEHGEHESQQTGPPPHVPIPSGIERATDDETGHGHHWHKHHAGLFLGGSSEKEARGFTLGGDYEFRLDKYVGVGVQAEHSFGDLQETGAVFPVFFHPGAGLRLATGPGFERFTGKVDTEHGEDEHHEGPEHDKDFHFLWRVQVFYDFPVGDRFTITPSMAVDFVSDRKIWIWGVTFGMGF